MKSIRGAVHDVIEQRVLPWIERDGISKLLLPEQITPEHCAEPPECRQPCNKRHRNHELAIGLTGKSTCCIEDKTVIFPPRRMVLLPAGTPHCLAQTKVRYTVNFDPRPSPTMLWLRAYPFGIRVQIMRTMNDADRVESSWWPLFLGRDFSRLMECLLEEVRSRPPDYALIGRYILLELMARCRRAAAADDTVDLLPMPAHRKEPAAASKQLSSRAQIAQEFIHSNYSMHITLDNIAEAADASNTLIIQEFKAATGMTPIAYLLKVRMDAAAELILSGVKVCEVAHIVGIEDPAYFSRIFKRTNGVSPLQYRRQIAEQASTSPTPAKSRKSRKSRNVK